MKKLAIMGIIFFLSMVGMNAQQKTVKVELINRITMTETTMQNGKVTQEVFKDYGISEVNRQLLFLTKYRLGLLRLKVIEDETVPDYKIVIDAVKNEYSEFAIIIFTNNKTGLTTQKITDGSFRHNMFQDDVSKKIIKFFAEIEKNDLYGIFLYDKKIEEQKYIFAKAGTEIKGALGKDNKVNADTDRLEIVSMDIDDMNAESTKELMIKIKYGNLVGFVNSKQLLPNK